MKVLEVLEIILIRQLYFVGCANIMKRVNVNLIDSMTLNCTHRRCRSPLHQATLCAQDPKCLASWSRRAGGEDCLMCRCQAQLPGNITTGAVAEFYVAFNTDNIPGNCPACETLEVTMMTSSNGKKFRLTGPLCGEFTGEFPSQRPVTRSFDVFFDLRLKNQLSK